MGITITDYAIYCTAEQTKKALELGAPISFNKVGEGRPLHYLVSREKRGYYEIPTAEQMIGWLEEHHIDCFVGKQLNHRFVSTVCVNEALIFSKPNYSRKGATLAAIDAALDYLGKAMEE